MIYNTKKVFSLINLILFLFISITTIYSQTALFSPETLYMGKIPVSSKAVRKLNIYNNDTDASHDNLQISSIQINDPNFSILNNPGSITLGRNQSIILEVEFLPTIAGMIESEISIQSNTTNGATVIPISGEGLQNTKPFFERIFGPEEGGSLGSIQQTSDDGYILVGSLDNPDEDGVSDIYIVKTDQFGEIEWTNIIEDEDNSQKARAVVLTNDEQYYMVLGETGEGSSGDLDFLLLKLDLDGHIVLSETYGGSRDDNSTSLVKCSDSGYLLVGYSDSFSGDATKDIYIVKVDSTGGEEWNETYGGSGGESASEAINTTDGGFAIVGKTDSKGAGDQDIWLLKLDADGDLLWDKTYGGSDRDGGSDVAEIPGVGYAITGYATGFGSGATDMFLVGTDESGDELWNSAFGEALRDNASNVIIVDDGIIIAGNVDVRQVGSIEYSDIWLIKTDFDGNMIWQEAFGGEESEGASEMILNRDNHIVITGSTTSYSKDNIVYFLNLTSAWGTLDVLDHGDSSIPVDFKVFPNYPNPFNSSTIISYHLKNDNHVVINIYDILGHKIQTYLDSYQIAGQHSIVWDAKGLAAGTYFLEVQTKNNSLVRKMMYLK
ncbi:T9SS type A sorting domain-containing protein [Candidatus Neomarinimicrobiota bacterium]